MSMETNSTSLPPQISPVKSPGSTQGTTAAARKSTVSLSPFSPQTNVDIKNSVADMAGILSKIAQEHQSNETSLSPQIQKILNQILEQSFSLNSTLSNGLGSTLESQRFSIDQMLTLGRMLAKLGNLSEQGVLKDLDASLQSLLQNVRQFFSEQNNGVFEPALLHKFAFELLNGQDLEDISPDLAKFLQDTKQLAETSKDADSKAKDAAQKFDNLLKALFPSKTEANAPEGQTAKDLNNIRQENTEKGNPTNIQRKPQNSSAEADEPNRVLKNNENLILKDKNSSRIFRQNDVGTSNAKNEMSRETFINKDSQGGQTQRAFSENKTSQEFQNTAKQEGQGRGNTAFADSTKNSSPEMSGFMKNSGSSIQSNPDELIQKQFKENLNHTGENVLKEQTAEAEALSKSMPENSQMKTAENLPMKNDAATMQNLKSLAALLIKDGKITENDTALLQNFVNQKQEYLSESDAKQLQMLLRLCQSNIPAAVRQAAGQQNLSDLPRLWAFMQLCDLANLNEKNPRNLRQASKKVYDFASMIKSSMTSEHAHSSAGTRSMDFMMPLYLGDHEKVAYPTYLHVYDESQPDPENPYENKKETWLRLCLLTEYIGAVDITFRMYDKTNLDVKVLFSDAEAVEEFKQYVPEFKKSFNDSVLQLSDLNIAMAGAKG